MKHQREIAEIPKENIDSLVGTNSALKAAVKLTANRNQGAVSLMNVSKSFRIFSAAILVASVPVFSGVNLSAASTNANLAVSATVANNCTITSNAISFGSYDPIVAHATANLDAAGSVVIACTKGATTTIGLDTGANASAGARRLASGGSFLTYELYQDTGRTTVWSNTGAGLLTVAAAPSKAARTYPVYARMAGGQDVPAGTYADTIVATVNF